MYSTSRMRIAAARTIPKQNIKSAGKMSCRRTLVKASALPLHFGFCGTQYLYSRSIIPLSFNHLTLKHEEMLSDHLDSTVSCQYSHNCTVMVCQLLYYDAVLTQARLTMQQVHSHFHSKFCTVCELVLLPANYSTSCFLKVRPEAAYIVFLS